MDADSDAPGRDLHRLRLVTGLAVALGLLVSVDAAWRQNWTYDEPYHMQWSRQLLHERSGSRDATPLFDSKTPVTLLNVLAKDAAVALGAQGWARSFWARLPGLWFVAALAVLLWVGRRFLGERAALLAVTFAALDPTLIGNAALATVDAAYAATTLVCLGAGLAWARRPSALRATAVGATLGLALATKFTAFLLVPGLVLVAGAYAWRGGLRPGARMLALHAAAAAAASVLVLDAAYLFVDVAQPLASARWRSTLMTAAAAAFPAARLPLPIDFLTGFDMCLGSERSRDWTLLVLGERQSSDGVAWYFAVTWLFKTPLLIGLAQLGGLLLLLRGSRPWRDPALLALGSNAALIWVYFSFFFRAQTGYRYLLPALPLMGLLAAAGWVGRARAGRSMALLAAVLVAATLAESTPYLGNQLAFTNASVWPKKRAWRTATNSIDNGQRDSDIARWLERAGEPIAFEPVHARPGANLIGLNSLAGGALWRQHRWLREQLEPERHVEHSYLLYRLDAAQYQRLLDESRRLEASAAGAWPCAEREGPALVLDESAPLPAPPGASAFVVCAEAPKGADLGLQADAGLPLFGLPAWRLREWDRLRAGEQAWYRLDPGLHALAVARTRHARLRWLAHGPIRLWLVPAAIQRGGYLRPLPADEALQSRLPE